jgi:integrase
VPLVDVDGRRIRGQDKRQAAELALARVKVVGEWRRKAEALPNEAPIAGEWLVAKVCSEFISALVRRAANGAVVDEYCKEISRYLNELCAYCGALPVTQLKKGHIEQWVANHLTWKSSATRRNAITAVLAAFKHSEEMHAVTNPLRGLKKPPPRPRLGSFTEADEQAIYGATDKWFRNFLFAAIHTGLRPFCELARLTANDVYEVDRGMMWRVFSSKTKKTRKIPVRPEVARLTRRLMRSISGKPGMPLLRTAQGLPWKKATGVARFLKIKRILGWNNDTVRSRYSTYTCRHTFAHRMLSGYWNSGAGCSIETLAELMGDTPKVAFDHYGKEWGQHYREPLWAAVGAGA